MFYYLPSWDIWSKEQWRNPQRYVFNPHFHCVYSELLGEKKNQPPFLAALPEVIQSFRENIFPRANGTQMSTGACTDLLEIWLLQVSGYKSQVTQYMPGLLWE